MPRRSFDDVRKAAARLPDVEECLYYGKPALKVRGQMFVCMASHSSAEPQSLVVRIDIDQRDALIAEQPDRYYLTDHYVGYASVLVRLGRVDSDALRDLVHSAYRFMSKDSQRVTSSRSSSSTRDRPRSASVFRRRRRAARS